jgi:hypothetical protein
MEEVQRMSSIELRRGTRRGARTVRTLLTTLSLLAVVLVVSPAAAVPANFDSTGVGFIPSTDVLGLASATIDINVPMLTAGDTSGGSSFHVDFTGSSGGEVCILAESQRGVCQADLVDVTTAYSALVTLEMSALNSSDITGPFTLLLTMLDLNAPNANYAADEVSLALDPMALSPLDMSAVSGFNFDGSFNSIVRIEDQACSNSGGNCHYLGWTVAGIGDTVTLRLDMSMAPDGRNSPRLLLNAVPLVVPEPGTALLMGFGLAGLSLAGRRVGREHR